MVHVEGEATVTKPVPCKKTVRIPVYRPPPKRYVPPKKPPVKPPKKYVPPKKNETKPPPKKYVPPKKPPPITARRTEVN